MLKKQLGRKSAIAAVAAFGMILSVVSTGTQAQAATKTTIAIAYDLGGRSQPGFNQLAYIGVKPILAKNKNLALIEAQATLSDTDDIRAERLRLMAKKASIVIAVGFLYNASLTKVSKEFPKVKFGIVDDSVDSPNVENILFKEQEGSFLVGVAAALKSTTGNVGYIGGVKTPLLQKFEAGFVAGAKAVNPKITVQTSYISVPPDFSGFNDPAKGHETALGMYQNGADVVYAAAGGTGGGVHLAAFEQKKWSIGVDADEATYASNAKVKDAILTSMLKRVDTGCNSFVSDVLANKFPPGNHVFGLANGGVGYALTGGHISDIKSKIDAYGAKIKSGAIVVPEKPEGA